MSASRHVAAMLVVLAACSSQKRDVVTLPKRDAVQAAHKPGLASFVERVEAIDAAKPDLEHARIVAALNALADTLEPMIEDRERIARIRLLATQLRESKPNESHSVIVVDAIATALEAIHRRTADATIVYAQALHAYEQLARQEPLSRQTNRVRHALEAIANTLATMAGKAPPFEATVVDAPRNVGEMRAHVARVKGLVAEAASAASSGAARLRMIEVLDALADTIRAAPSNLEREHVDALASPVAFAARRLEQVGELSFERADLMKAGLDAAVDGLDALSDAPPGSALALLLESARASVRGIDEHSSFVFERAQIQDALRAVADVYVVFAAGT